MESRWVVRAAVAAFVVVSLSTPLVRAQAAKAAATAPVKTPEREAWRKSMARRPLPKKGCFTASYPGTTWQEIKCGRTSQLPNRPRSGDRTGRGGNTVGDTSGDFSAQTAGLISSAEGSFNSVDVSGGPDTNAYMLQLNTQFFPNPSACNGVPGCLGWQQFIYSPTQCNGGPGIFIEYWLIGYGSCPGAPWIQQGGGDCFFNGPCAPVTAQSVADLSGLTMTATASAGGQDTLVLSTSTMQATGQDSVLSLANFWNTAEFNAFGDCCDSETVLNNPTTLVVKTTIDDGTTNAPTCGTSSFTAETNSLDLVSPCCPYGGSSPAIEFMETSAGHTATCGPTALVGDPHITTADGARYDFQGAGEYVSLRDLASGTEIQTRQKPVSTTFIGTDAYDALTTCVSLNTAVAVRVAGHRVTYEPNLDGVPDPTGLQLRIDGVLTPLGPQGRAVGAGGRVVPVPGGGLEIDFPDGKVLLVNPEWWASQSLWYLNVAVSNLGLVAVGAKPTLGGIAAPLAVGSWLPALPGGVSMGPMPAALPQRFSDLYQKFGNAWRVTARDTLFDYAPGTSTSTFTMRDWPREQPPCVVPNTKPVEPATDAVAKLACQRVMDPATRASCVFDVKITGNPGFAKTYLATQRTLADATRTSMTSDVNPSQVGELVTFTAVVAPSSTAAKGVAVGTVQFAVDGANAGEAVDIDARGRARWATARLKVGKHQVTASFLPGADSQSLPSTSLERVQTVKRCSCDADNKR